MLPDLKAIRPVRIALIVIAVAASAFFLLRSSPAASPTVKSREQNLHTAELEQEATAARAATVVKRAADATAATKPALARAKSLRSRVIVERSGELLVQDADTAAPAIVPVPPLVTDRIQADSAAIAALTLALTWDTRAEAAQQEQLLADARARDAARLTIAQLEHERNPRCGRRCGMVLGAASVVALGIAVGQASRLLR